MLMIAQRNMGRSGISAPKWNEEMLLGLSMILLAFFYIIVIYREGIRMEGGRIQDSARIQLSTLEMSSRFSL